MKIFDLMKKNNQEQIAFYCDKSVHLRAILAIHSTALGPAIGGIRIRKYQSVEEGVFDLVRLSKAMTYKTAAAELNFGGGEIVIIESNETKRNEGLFRAVGRFIESMKGRFIAAEDIGVTEESMEQTRMETQYVSGLPSYYGGSGDHSYMGAYGTYLGIKAAAQFRWKTSDLSGRKVIVQGYGRIGKYLSPRLRQDGAEVFIYDIHPDRMAEAEKNGFQTIHHTNNIFQEKCHIFSPCAMGPIINKKTAGEFQCEIIAGSANNQLLSEADDLHLKNRNILYVPDFIINAGGSIDVSEEYLGYNRKKVEKKTENIYDRTLEILTIAEKNNETTNQRAINYAINRIHSIKNIRGTFLGKGKI